MATESKELTQDEVIRALLARQPQGQIRKDGNVMSFHYFRNLEEARPFIGSITPGTMTSTPGQIPTSRATYYWVSKNVDGTVVINGLVLRETIRDYFDMFYGRIEPSTLMCVIQVCALSLQLSPGGIMNRDILERHCNMMRIIVTNFMTRSGSETPEQYYTRFRNMAFDLAFGDHFQYRNA